MTEITKLLAIIGSAKAGTTAVAHHLAAHPQACLGPRKETRYFTSMGAQDWAGPGSDMFQRTITMDLAEFAANFQGLERDHWAIDASTDYLWREETPDLLGEFAAHCDVRVLCIVRDPVDRAVSEYNHTISAKLETLSFTDSLEAEGERFAQCWQPLFYHRRRSTISDDIQRFADRFGDRLMVIDYEELKDANAVTRRLCDFLDLPAMPAPDIERRNESFVPRNALVNAAMKNQAIRGLGRSLLPKGFRQALRQKLVVNTRGLVTVQSDERTRFRDLIADEIEACRRNPLIPTASWSCI